MITWQVELIGDVDDLEFLESVLSTGLPRVVRDQRGASYLYESDSFCACSTSEEVEKLAKSEVAVLSGILKLERRTRKGLKLGAVYRLNSNGGRDVFVHIRESIQIRAEIGAMAVIVTDSTGNVKTERLPPPRSRVMLSLSIGDADVAKVLRLLSAADATTWVGLYRIYEVIQSDVGSKQKFEKLGWASVDNLQRFKHSANSVQVGGDGSRHGKESQEPPKKPMTLSEAEAFVNFIVHAWLASKGV